MVRLRAIVLAAAVSVLAAGCGRAGHGEALDRIGALVEDDAAAAASALDSLDRGVMDEAQGNYYDFLKLKSDDKRYERHKSDSTIVRLMEYYRGTEMEAEVTYYAGRVYSDLGDYPTALRYFQDANEMTKGDKRKLALRSCITSQTGGLLNDMRLYREAIPYLVETIEIDSALNCAKDLPLDNQLLGAVYMHLKEYDKAEGYFRKALSQATNEGDSAIIEAYIANKEYEMGDTASALRVARGLPERCMDLDRNYILAIASKIYHRAGIQDTAVMYATQLIEREEPANKIRGYYILLKPDLRKMIVADSLDSYLRNYTRLLEKRADKSMADQVIYQQSRYNYMLHERKSEKLAREKARGQAAAAGAIIVLGVIAAMSLYQRKRTESEVRELQIKLREIKRIENEQTPKSSSREPANDVETLRKQLKDELNRLSGQGVKAFVVAEMLDSANYKELQSTLSGGKSIGVANKIWSRLTDDAERIYPNLRITLDRLSGGRMTVQEWRLALLIKLGLSPNQCAVIMAMSPGSITYHRNKLAEKLFSEKSYCRELDSIIYLL